MANAPTFSSPAAGSTQSTPFTIAGTTDAGSLVVLRDAAGRPFPVSSGQPIVPVGTDWSAQVTAWAGAGGLELAALGGTVQAGSAISVVGSYVNTASRDTSQATHTVDIDYQAGDLVVLLVGGGSGNGWITGVTGGTGLTWVQRDFNGYDYNSEYASAGMVEIWASPAASTQTAQTISVTRNAANAKMVRVFVLRGKSSWTLSPSAWAGGGTTTWRKLSTDENWSAATTYGVSGGQHHRCYYSGHVFETIAGGNLNHTPTVGGDAYWTDLGAVSRTVQGLALTNANSVRPAAGSMVLAIGVAQPANPTAITHSSPSAGFTLVDDWQTNAWQASVFTLRTADPLAGGADVDVFATANVAAADASWVFTCIEINGT